MMHVYYKVCDECSMITTKNYSTSFWSATGLLESGMRSHIHNIYGFVRFADEIVDSFHDFDKEALLSDFKNETYKALLQGISLNPILNSFQKTVRIFDIDLELVDAFFKSMEMDLFTKSYNKSSYNNYIYGSAEVVGMMCLAVFCNGDTSRIKKLEPSARALGSAFQKVNFLRDVRDDYEILNRVYFPDVDFYNFSAEQKRSLEKDIEADFTLAEKGINELPAEARAAVMLAYKYYRSLFKKIRACTPETLLTKRIRVPDFQKLFILMRLRLFKMVGVTHL